MADTPTPTASEGIGANVRRYRSERGMGLRELSRAAEVPHGYLSEIEHGKRPQPGAFVVYRLARALEVPMTDLMGVPSIHLPGENG